ncbi:succinate dehydrogenase assembly factor 3, mitochondrial-like [Styela clava]|uniref:succinate dehydrogenase assembly factor 3, mitochondrial-like n=1 Tax=Styela clava TaxID=7725 RepID=UPI00193A689A|nr:succinate dehydrogenase assembly factor 3, mitochondrial-like [Styela clava]
MSHVRTVRSLYKRILKLHQLLPPDLKAVGDQYCKQEFKQHKTAKPEFVLPFLEQWREYANTLELQLSQNLSQGKELNPNIGENISENVLESDFNSGHIVQLHELMKETSKPSTQFRIEEEKWHDTDKS